MATERNRRQDAFNTALGFMEKAQGYADDETRRLFERVGCRYFWLGCGMDSAGVASPRQPHARSVM